MILNIGIRLKAVSVQTNLLQQVKSQRDGRSQNASNSDMNQKFNESSVSVQANLLQQVKSRSDGRSQNRRVVRGLPI
jgi:hypothetical protein